MTVQYRCTSADGITYVWHKSNYTFNYRCEVQRGGRGAELTVRLLLLLHLDSGGVLAVQRCLSPLIGLGQLFLQRLLLHRERGGGGGPGTGGPRPFATGSPRLRLPPGLRGRAGRCARLFLEKVRENGSILLGAPLLQRWWWWWWWWWWVGGGVGGTQNYPNPINLL